LFSGPLHWWWDSSSSSSRLEKVSKCKKYGDGERQCGFLCSFDTIYAWDVEKGLGFRK
jgi:hypothetical protein